MRNAVAHLQAQARDIINQHEYRQLVTLLRQRRLLLLAARAMLDCGGGVTTEQLAAYTAIEAAVKAAEDKESLCESEDYIHKLDAEGKL